MLLKGETMENKEEKLLNDISKMKSEIRMMRQDIASLTGMVRSLLIQNVPDIVIEDSMLSKPIPPKALSTRAYNALRFADFHVIGDLEYVSLQDLRRIRNIGPTMVKEISEYAKQYLIDIPEKEPKCKLPQLHEGQVVICRDNYKSTDVFAYDSISKGAVLTVHHTRDDKSNYGFHLPEYVCTDILNKSYDMSPAQIMTVDTKGEYDEQ